MTHDPLDVLPTFISPDFSNFEYAPGYLPIIDLLKLFEHFQ